VSLGIKKTTVMPSQMTKKYEINRGIRYRFANANVTVLPSYVYTSYE